MSPITSSSRIEVEACHIAEIPAVEEATSRSWNSSCPTRGIYYDGPEYRKKPTRVFAFLGVPEVAGGERVPGIVLVHGGGGTAFREWVELWMARGYAAIAMDLCGCIPVYAPGTRGWLKIENGGGPDGWDASFAQLDQPLADQWPYYAVNAIARARTLLGHQPGVDPDRIAITGVSWGGVLTCLTAALDSRYVAAISVYGCGFLRDKSVLMETLRKPELARWSECFDPAAYLSGATMPILWVIGTNDGAFPLEALEKSARLAPTPVTRSITLRMPHAHGGPGELPEAIRITTDYYCKGEGALLPRIADARVEHGVLHVQGQASLPGIRAELLFTCDRETAERKWDRLNWESRPAEVAATRNGFTVAVPVPEGATQYLVNVYDRRGVPASSRLYLAGE